MWMFQNDASQRRPISLDRALGGRLKTYFDQLTESPPPDRLVQLAEALEEALEQGDLGRPPNRN
jgi:hypothetical protein